MIAGNTALCTVGRTGNDLHYRGYDILDIAETCEFEEIAHLLVHGKLPTAAELAAYKAKLKSLRGLPAAVQGGAGAMPASAHPMDVMRTRRLGAGLRAAGEGRPQQPGARDIADRLMASLGSMLLYWHHYAHNGRRIDVETDDDSIGGALPASAARRSRRRRMGAGDAHLADPLRRARVQRLDLHRALDRRHRLGHVFGDHRRDRRAARAQAWRRQRGRVRNPEALQRCPTRPRPTSARRVEAKEVVIGFGHPVYTIADPRNKVIKEVARSLSRRRANEDVRHRRPHRER